MKRIEIIPKAGISVRQAQRMASEFNLGISNVVKASRGGFAIVSIDIFGNNWDSSRKILLQLLGAYKGDSNYDIYEMGDEGHAVKLSPQRFSSKVRGVFAIESTVLDNIDAEVAGRNGRNIGGP